MSKKFSGATSWIVNRRWLAFLIIALISATSLGGFYAPADLVQWLKSVVKESLVRPEQREYFDSDVVREEEDFNEPPQVETVRTFGYDMIMLVESDSFFTPEGSEAIREVVDHLESLNYVYELLWMDQIPTLNLFGLNEPLLPNKFAAQQRFENALETARAHPLVHGQLLADDGKSLLLMIELDYLFVRDDETLTSGLRKEAESVAAKFPDVEMDFFVTGRVPVMMTAIQAQEDNRLKYQTIAYGMILLLSMLLFRGAIAVIVVALAPFFGVFWTSGIIRYFDFQMNPFNDVVLPILVALVGFTDGVHLMVQIRRERAAGLGPFDAAKEGVRKVGLACFLTSLTTAVGFGSLALADHELVRELGYCCVIGVAFAFISVVLTIPLACSTWLGQRIHKGHGKGLIDQNLSRVGLIIYFVMKRPRTVSAVGILLSLALFATSLTLRPDERQGDLLPPKSEPAIALKKMDTAFGGLEQGSININWDRLTDDKSGGPKFLTVLKEVDELLAKEELIGFPISIFNLLDALPGGGDIEDRASMLDLLPPSLKRTYYTPEFRSASIAFRTQDLGIARYGPVFQRIENGLDEICARHPGFKHSMHGEPVWRWRNIYQIVNDLVKSLGTAAIIIFIILAIVYRSFRIGIISILPNMFPLCVAGTYLALTGQALEIVTVCAFTCCLGIAVDDTIHFLTRYVEEKRETENEDEAIRKAFIAVGTALVMTTLVLVSGFLTVLFSDGREHRIFASMGAITVAAALFGDLVFLPAILKTFANKKSESDTTEDKAS